MKRRRKRYGNQRRYKKLLPMVSLLKGDEFEYDKKNRIGCNKVLKLTNKVKRKRKSTLEGMFRDFAWGLPKKYEKSINKDIGSSNIIVFKFGNTCWTE